LIGVLIFILIFIFVKNAPQGKKSVGSVEELPFWKGVKCSVVNKQNICCGLYIGFMNLPLMIISAVWGTLFLTQAHHISLTKASFIVSMICIGTIVGSPIYGWISDKIQRRRLPMTIGGVCSLIVMGIIIVFPNPSEEILTFLFFSLGLFTSSQVIGYPMITENNPKELGGISMGIAALVIMGMAALLQPLSGKLLDYFWDGTMLEGAPLYSMSNFQIAFMIFPIGFVLALFALSKIKESKVKV
jgi:MFS family permease